MSISEATTKAQQNANETGAEWAVVEDRVHGGYIVRLWTSALLDLPSVSAVISPA
jgi:hypothetical protein